MTRPPSGRHGKDIEDLIVDFSAEPPFALGRFSRDGQRPFDGVAVRGRVVPLQDTPAAGLAMFDDWERLVGILSNWSEDRLEDGVPVDELHTHAPVVPSQLFCSGANYREHVIELVVAQQIEQQPGEDREALRSRAAAAMDERAAHGRPYAFVGLPSAVCGPYDDVILPAYGTQHDWEVELGVVIGRTGRHVPRDKALGYVAGYTIVNDITARDLVFRPDIPGIGSDWLASKNSPTFFPTGPYVVPAAFVDPADLGLVLRLNGEVMQNGRTSDMIFDVARLIEYVSTFTELRPGDLLITGSPAGNGAHHGRYLQAGDLVESEITGLGTQRNRCVAG
jgi:2,4-didehydro-3-deoxy-L-rhamnonate hydrolase